MELETVQNELKQLRDQQQLLSNMEQVGSGFAFWYSTLSSVFRIVRECSAKQQIFYNLFFVTTRLFQSQGIEGSRVVPECDREMLWESLREKQAAQLDRLKKSEPKYE